jgi:hypothetical protein
MTVGTIMLVGSAISAAGQAWGGAQAKKAAYKQAKNAWADTLEQARRLDLEQKYGEHLASARMSASGVVTGAMSGTPQDVQLHIEQENQKNYAWLLQAGHSRERAIRKGGDISWYGAAVGAASTVASGWAEYEKYKVS